MNQNLKKKSVLITVHGNSLLKMICNIPDIFLHENLLKVYFFTTIFTTQYNEIIHFKKSKVSTFNNSIVILKFTEAVKF